MKNKIRFLILPTVLASGLVLAGCNSNAPAPGSANSAEAPAVTTAQKAEVPFDQQFIDSMVPHHESAVMMAQMVVDRAQFPEVRALAKAIIADQDREIAQMKAWRKAWFGSEEIPPMIGHGAVDHSQMDHSNMKHEDAAHAPGHSDVMTMPGNAMGLPITGAMDMKKLREAKGAEVDREFLRMMVPHHANAVVLAQEVLIQSQREELRQLSRQIIASQAREIGTMESIARKQFGAL